MLANLLMLLQVNIQAMLDMLGIKRRMCILPVLNRLLALLDLLFQLLNLGDETLFFQFSLLQMLIMLLGHQTLCP